MTLVSARRSGGAPDRLLDEAHPTGAGFHQHRLEPLTDEQRRDNRAWLEGVAGLQPATARRRRSRRRAQPAPCTEAPRPAARSGAARD